MGVRLVWGGDDAYTVIPSSRSGWVPSSQPTQCPIYEVLRFNSSDVLRSERCELCQAGFSTVHTNGETQCLPCYNGTFTNRSGMLRCESCAAGTMQAAAGQSACISCVIMFRIRQACTNVCKPGRRVYQCIATRLLAGAELALTRSSRALLSVIWRRLEPMWRWRARLPSRGARRGRTCHQKEHTSASSARRLARPSI